MEQPILRRRKIKVDRFEYVDDSGVFYVLPSGHKGYALIVYEDSVDFETRMVPEDSTEYGNLMDIKEEE